METLLRDEEREQWSDREIIHCCHVHYQLVATVRNELILDDHPVWNCLLAWLILDDHPVSTLASTDSVDTANRLHTERIFIHPKTGEPTR